MPSYLSWPVAADEDVVAAFAEHLVEAAVAEEDVVADHRVLAEGVEVVAGGAVLRAHFDPVVAFVAVGERVEPGAEDEVVARAGEDVRDVLAGDDEVAARTAEDQVRVPLPPWMTSLPASPWMTSSPPMSVMMSSPSPP